MGVCGEEEKRSLRTGRKTRVVEKMKHDQQDCLLTLQRLTCFFFTRTFLCIIFTPFPSSLSLLHPRRRQAHCTSGTSLTVILTLALLTKCNSSSRDRMCSLFLSSPGARLFTRSLPLTIKIYGLPNETCPAKKNLSPSLSIFFSISHLTSAESACFTYVSPMSERN